MPEKETAPWLTNRLFARRAAGIARLASTWAGECLELPEEINTKIRPGDAKRFCDNMQSRIDLILRDSQAKVEPADLSDINVGDMPQDAQNIRAPAEPAYILYFHDKEVPPMIFSGEGAEECAWKAFEAKRTAWTCNLFKEVARG